MQFMRLLAGLRETDRRLTQNIAACTAPGVHRTLSAVEECAQSTKPWCAAAAVMTCTGGWRGRRTAAVGLAALAAIMPGAKLSGIDHVALVDPHRDRGPPPDLPWRMWSPITGERDAVLADASMTAEQADRLPDWVEASGKNLTISRGVAGRRPAASWRARASSSGDSGRRKPMTPLV
jgi:hypothetical protein